jgi:predicted regulator of Ras-like GTPase activity (Roadblock/LC7/MglB family)
MISGLSAEAQNVNWLLNTFAGETAGVVNAIAVSSDGLLMASSGTGDGAGSDRLAAIISGLISLAGGAAANYQLGTLDKVIIDMSEGYLLVIAVNEGCALGVVASKSAALGSVAFEMGLFANRAGPVLTPRLIHELKNSVMR